MVEPVAAIAAKGGSHLPMVAILGVALAIAVTTTMDATGLSALSALPLCLLMIAFWRYERHSRHDIGFVSGKPGDYALAVLHPVVVLGVIASIALATGAASTSRLEWGTTGRDILLISVTTMIVAAITEEGFFRGWLWASLERQQMSEKSVIAWTSVAFSLWHLSAVALDTGFDLPASQIPVFMVNATLLGIVWGLLRSISGSVIVASVSHGMWNGLNYPLFAFGTKTGALGIGDVSLYGPEVGLLGIVFNSLFIFFLWRRSRLAIFANPEPSQ